MKVNLDGYKYYKKEIQVADWTQPTLTANGTMGGSSFACNQSASYSGTTIAFRCFNGDTTTSGETNRWQINNLNTSTEYYIYWYNPVALNISNLKVWNEEANLVVKGYTLYGSNDNSTWTIIKSGTNTVTTAKTAWNIPVSMSTEYKYFRLGCKPNSSTALEVMEIQITATTKQEVAVEATEEDYDIRTPICSVFKIDGKYYAWSKTGGSGEVPVLPDTPTEPDVPVEPDVPTVAVNAQLYGNVKNNNGVLSGFGINSYAVLDGTIPNTYDREFVIGFKTGNDITTKQAVFTTNLEEQLRGWWLYLENGKLFFGWNGTYNSVNVHELYTVEPNTEYYLKIQQPSVRQRLIYISNDGANTWTQIKNDNTSISGDNWGGVQGTIALGMEGQSAGANDTEPIGAFLGTFNMNGSYIKESDITIWKGISEPNYGVNLVGNPQNNNGVLSNFSKGSYAVVNYKLPETFSSFEFVIRCTMPNFTDIQGLFSTNFEDRNNAMTIGFSSNTLWVGCNGVATSRSISGAGVEYWWKYVYDGSTVKSYRKTETSDYELLTNMDTPSFNGKTGTISFGVEGSDVLDRYNRGTFNLNGDYIKVDGVIVWEGVKTS